MTIDQSEGAVTESRMNAGHGASDRVAVVCALEFERRALERAGIGEHADLLCIGAGAERVVAWCEREGAPRRRVILVGLCGALRESGVAGRGYLAATIIAPSGRQFRSDLAVQPKVKEAVARAGLRLAVVASADHVLTTPSEKRAVAEKTSAELVDMESAVFAEAATVFGWRWAIVRGVSDGCDDVLPRDIEKWVDERGRVRCARILIALTLRPWTVFTVMRLRRSSRGAMNEAARGVECLLDVLDRPVDSLVEPHTADAEPSTEVV